MKSLWVRMWFDVQRHQKLNRTFTSSQRGEYFQSGRRAGCPAALLAHLTLFFLPLDSFFQPQQQLRSQRPELKTTLMPSRCALLDLMLVPIRMDPFPPQGGNHINDCRRGKKGNHNSSYHYCISEDNWSDHVKSINDILVWDWMNTTGIISHTLISSCCSVFHLIYCVLLVTVQGAPGRLCLIKSNNRTKACAPLEFSGRNQRFFLRNFYKHEEKIVKMFSSSQKHHYFIIISLSSLLICS